MLFLLSGLFACNTDGFWKEEPENLSPEKDFNRVEVADAYSLLIPKYMSEDQELHKDASLAYGNEKKGVYVVVLEESLALAASRITRMDGYEDSLDLIENYLRVTIRMAGESMQLPVEGASVRKEIDGNQSVSATLSGQLEETPLAYRFTSVKGRERIYLIMCWTSAEKKQNFENTFTKIADSFELVNLVKN